MKRWVWNRSLPVTVNLARGALILLIVIGILHKFIANDIPILANTNTGLKMPVINDYLYSMGLHGNNPHMSTLEYKALVSPLIPYNPYNTDVDNILVSPVNQGYVLGTDALGRDVFSGLIHGTATAVIVSLGAVGLALLIAIILGVTSGYYHRRPIRLNTLEIALGILILLMVIPYLVTEMMSDNTSLWMILLPVTGGLVIWKLITPYLKRLPLKKRNIYIHSLTDRIIEVREAIPTIFLILGAIALFRDNSMWNVTLVIGLIGWGSLSRYIRAEVMKIREKSYIDAAIIQGQSTWRIIIRHILPNALDPLLSIVTFSFTAAILLEATLSFLGLGIPPEAPTWGSLLAQARTVNAWWLAIFPGMCIFIAIASLNTIADYLQGRLDVRIRN